MPTSDGRFRGVSVPRVWPGHPDFDTAAHNDRMIEKARRLAKRHPDCDIVLPVYKRRVIQSDDANQKDSAETD